MDKKKTTVRNTKCKHVSARQCIKKSLMASGVFSKTDGGQHGQRCSPHCGHEPCVRNGGEGGSEHAEHLDQFRTRRQDRSPRNRKNYFPF